MRLVHFHQKNSHFLIWKWKCDIEDWKLKRTDRQTSGQKQLRCLNPSESLEYFLQRFSFLPKQNKTTLCDRWLRVSENTLLLELTPCVFWLFRETLDFLLAIYSWFFEAVWIFLLFQFFKLFSLLDVNLLPRSVHLSPKSVHFLLPQKSLSVNRKLGVRGKESGKYKGGRSREARLNSLRRLGILREKQRIQQMPLHTLSIRKQPWN